ncbi:hypothetical protein C8R45DRAFT_1131756, partial [Mycena sanguinolenta]
CATHPPSNLLLYSLAIFRIKVLVAATSVRAPRIRLCLPVSICIRLVVCFFILYNLSSSSSAVLRHPRSHLPHLRPSSPSPSSASTLTSNTSSSRPSAHRAQPRLGIDYVQLHGDVVPRQSSLNSCGGILDLDRWVFVFCRILFVGA